LGGCGLSGGVFLLAALLMHGPAAASSEGDPPGAAPAVGVAGRVIWEDGKPAAGVRVYARAVFTPDNLTPQERRSPSGFATTDAQGRYGFSQLLSGDYDVTVEDPAGKGVAVAARTTAVGGELRRVPDLVLGPGVLLDVAVVDEETGKPIEGIHVLNTGPHRPPGSIPRVRAVSDADGRCQLRMAPGKNELRVNGPVDGAGRQDFQTEIDVPRVATRKVLLRVNGRLFACAVIEGRVIDEDGKPAAGVRVMAQIQDQVRAVEPEWTWAETTTRADGSYRLIGLATASYNVSVEEPSGKLVAEAAEGVGTRVRRAERLPDIVLTPGAIVEGTVTDESTGKSVPGISVGSHGPHRPQSSAMIISSMTDAQGRYRLRVAPGESYIYVADGRVANAGRRGFNDRTVTLKKGETAMIEFRVKLAPPGDE
jgi:hypothetical protein